MNYLKCNFKVTQEWVANNYNKFSYFINCTNNTCHRNNDVFYELTLSVLYEKHKNKEKIESFTIVDGEFSSLYPFDIDTDIYTLTHVKYAPIIKSDNIEDIHNFDIHNFDIKNQIALIEEDFVKFYPEFKEYFTYNSFFLSVIHP